MLNDNSCYNFPLFDSPLNGDAGKLDPCVALVKFLSSFPMYVPREGGEGAPIERTLRQVDLA